MAVSLAIILLLGLLVSKLFEKIKLPGLLGMIILGTIIGPYGLNWLHGDMINVSADLRKIALIIILLRAGLGINKKDLKKVGKTAFKMSCVPGIIEGFSIAFVSIKLLEFSFIEGGMLGFIIAAVSPAVVVPSMLNLLESSIGTNKGIPTLILAGASIDDIFAITIFSTFLGLYSGANINIGIQLLNIPVSIILGIIAGGIIGFIMVRVFSKYHIRDTKKVLLILGTSILFTELEKVLKTKIEIASLLGVMTIGFVIIKKIPDVGKGLALKFNKIWIFTEILLFVLVGAEVNVNVAINAGKMGIVVILIGLLGRSIGVIISLLGTDLNWKERLFCVIAYVPKATVQAAMGAVPLSLGVESGDIILAMAVLSIIITAPLGAIGINFSAKRLLYVDNRKE
ncbi:potassium transporter [Clostridium tetani]|uniref:cation:proton antiporter domain-containing protein n=1 Tax=Clostridium tetani TaxID=1513 RepID=UPI00100B0950|nr:cation:proton antiporter [Clostridium tetani]RXI53763.1 sodium:proton antiporter [Clostridium tetani]RXI54693.1 sodium:proton antiporter [Clostridium tetani]RXM70412.1 sodium:proton antiporter [Clostridium tetani]BDR70523.1 potassium transporter [Clostridium tetani]BDR73389.1 potassium transporter [Clostridium tetani]